MKKIFLGLFLLISFSALADSLESCAYTATTNALESENSRLTKAQLAIKILNVVEGECLMSEGSTIQSQSHNPSLAKGIKKAIVDFKKTHVPQRDIQDVISELL